jgi:hypothetical protein
MYKATRDLIIARQQHSNFYVTQAFNVDRCGGGAPNDCFNNAYNCVDTKMGIKIVSGWLVARFDNERGSTEITQHYWNINADGIFFDTTPGVTPEFEYVIDSGISIWSQMNYEHINSCVCSSLIYKDGMYIAVNEVNGKLLLSSLNDLSEESLFANNMIDDNIVEKLVA